MEHRKLVGFGKASYVVTLPKEWIKNNNLNKGDTVKLDTKENIITLTTENTEINRPVKEESRLVLNTEKLLSKGFNEGDEREKSYFISMLIFSAYVNGYDIIIIEGNKKIIKEIIEDIVGLEVIEETSKRVITRFLIDIKEVSLDKMLNRVDSMFRTLLDYLKNPKEWDELIIFEKKRLRSLCLLSARVATKALKDFESRKMLNVSSSHAASLRELFRQFRSIGSKFGELASFLSEKKLTATEKSIIFEVVEKIEKYHIKLMKIYKEKSSSNEELAKYAGESYKIGLFIKEKQKKYNKNVDLKLALNSLYNVCSNQGIVNILLEELKSH